METNCTGNVTRFNTIKDVQVDSEAWRSVTVHLTRCTSCPGTAQVVDFDGLRTLTWNGIEIPADYANDDAWAAYWAAEVTAHRPADRIVDTPAPLFEVVAAFTYDDDENQPF